MSDFEDLGVSPKTLGAMGALGITTPVPVQEHAIPALLDDRDVVIQAPTGSGKTLAFLVPLVEDIGEPGPGPRGLVVTPTRELAIQVHEVLEGLDHGVRVALLYGGVGYATQTEALKRGVDIVVGTPGRILDMVGRKLLSLSRVEYLVLDEADEMLDAGFAPDVERIIGMAYEPQTVLASATMPEWVERMIDRHLQDPERIVVQPPDESTLEHGLAGMARADKLGVLVDLLKRLDGTALVFGRTRHGVAKLTRDLRRMGIPAAELQGDLSQVRRDRTMAAFRDGQVTVLVATNVAARGLDVSHVSLVVNFELPDTPEWLTHRIGRTARMGQAGWALTFVSPEDHRAWRRLRRLGAPDLPHIDVAHLLKEGDWRYLESPPEPFLAPKSGPAASPGGGGRGGHRGGRRRGGRRPSRPVQPNG
ncbi:MAG: DEAD/DEAH box helicase [Candidatus Dormibacteraeota bacterium]|nr:DEAD/DEAH box helicase [Candidatus Dormibacteraeota bacterium]